MHCVALYCTRFLYIRPVSSNADTFIDLLCTYAVGEVKHRGQDFTSDTIALSYSHCVTHRRTRSSPALLLLPIFLHYHLPRGLCPLLPTSPYHPIQNTTPTTSPLRGDLRPHRSGIPILHMAYPRARFPSTAHFTVPIKSTGV